MNESGVQNAMQKVYPALVRIYIVVTQPQNGRIERRASAGSGAIISPDGYIVTNHHVAGNASHIVVNLANQEEVRADVVGTDPLTDIAVIKIRTNELKNPDKPLPTAKWADSDKARPGDVVYAMGSPGALSQSITQGILANTNMVMSKLIGNMQLDGEDISSMITWFSHDAQIFGGNSGGPLVNTDGHIVGVNHIGIAGLGGAVPSNVARNSAKQIIEHGEVPRSWIGIELQPRLRSDKSKASGVLVSGVLPGSPAEKAGLKAGDLITHLGKQAVNCEIPEHKPAINQIIANTPIGSTIKVSFIRDGKQINQSVKTLARQRNILPVREFKTWGMTARNVSRTDSIKTERKNTNGVIIDSVRTNGPLTQAKPQLNKDDIITHINGKAVNNISELQKKTKTLVNKSNGRPSLLVTAERGKQEILSVLRLGKEEPTSPAVSLKKAYLPVETQVVTAELANALKLNVKAGVRITSINTKKKLALEVGDIITRIDNETVEASRVEDTRIFSSMLRQYRAGNLVEMDIIRDGKVKKVNITLMSPPDAPEELPTYEDELFEFTARDLAHGDDEKKTKGVEVSKVETGGWANIGNLQTEDIIEQINGKTVNNVKQLEQLLINIRQEKPRYIVLFIKRGVRSLYLEIEPQWQS